MVTVTDVAARKIQDLKLEEGKPEWGLRLRVVGGGCSGFSYELGWEDAAAEGDQILESAGVKVFVDPQSAQYVTGAEVDYVDGPVRLRLLHQEPERQGLLRLRALLPGLALG